jgi:hypothetical protein
MWLFATGAAGEFVSSPRTFGENTTISAAMIATATRPSFIAAMMADFRPNAKLLPPHSLFDSLARSEFMATIERRGNTLFNVYNFQALLDLRQTAALERIK